MMKATAPTTKKGRAGSVVPPRRTSAVDFVLLFPPDAITRQLGNSESATSGRSGTSFPCVRVTPL